MTISKINNLRPGMKDIWNSFMCKEAVFSENDIPFCPTIVTEIPKKILTWPEAKTIYNKQIKIDKDFYCDAFICFYIDDQKFDGKRCGIWTDPYYALSIIKHFKGIITPDFSTYQDFPDPLKRYNTYRMRAFGYWVGENGVEVINNIRWGSEETYSYCFDGVDRNSIIAIGTVGGGPKKLDDRERFINGLTVMVDRIAPKTIIVYGSAAQSCFNDLRESGIEIVAYKSQTASAFEKRSGI